MSRTHVARRVGSGVPLILLLLAGCASAAPSSAPAAPTPTAPVAAVGPDTALAPPAAAERTSERVQVTGTELGTMWTFENPPIDYWQKKYGFNATEQWLRHVRLASVRYANYCSASFVSPNGLVMTNHHCARECVEASSTSDHDYVTEGFYAASRGEEKPCPDLYLDQLVEIQDVTDRVQSAAPAGAAARDVAAIQDSVRDAIERECTDEAKDLVCQVVVLFRGGQDQLYRYHRFRNVKLVFAPELQAAYFGGDYDNFTYPRYDLDFSFVRAYADDGSGPASTPEYLRWNAQGAKEGDLVFIVGNPGSTNRLSTVAQLMYERKYRHPLNVWVLQHREDLLEQMVKNNPAAARELRQDQFETQNSLKAFTGELRGLQDSILVGRKIAWEKQFRQRVQADPQLQAQYGDVWQKLADLQHRKLEVSPRLNVNSFAFFALASPQMQVAGQLVQYLKEKAKPATERDTSLTPQAMQQLEGQLGSPLNLDTGIGTTLLGQRLEFARDWLPSSAPFVKAAFQAGESPQAAAQRLIRGSRIDDAQFRTSLLQGGMAALQSVDDPLIRLALQMDSVHAGLVGEWQDVLAAENVQQERLAKALFAVYGKKLPPEATLTLRISDGVMRGYDYNGTKAPAKTTFYGLYGRAADFENDGPFELADRVAARRDSVDMAVPLDFVTTNDITGGNSGSPLIDREGRLVGIAFDSNIEGLPNQFLFTDEAARAVGVDAAGILEGLSSIYGAKALVQEILGGSGR